MLGIRHYCILTVKFWGLDYCLTQNKYKSTKAQNRKRPLFFHHIPKRGMGNKVELSSSDTNGIKPMYHNQFVSFIYINATNVLSNNNIIQRGKQHIVSRLKAFSHSKAVWESLLCGSQQRRQRQAAKLSGMHQKLFPLSYIQRETYLLDIFSSSFSLYLPLATRVTSLSNR